MNTVAPQPLDKGLYTIEIDCRDRSGAMGAISMAKSELSVVGIGDG